jgi:hypothetical protein
MSENIGDSLRSGKLKGVWPRVVETLAMYGVNTFEDLSKCNVLQVLSLPRFGEGHLSRFTIELEKRGMSFETDWSARPLRLQIYTRQLP